MKINWGTAIVIVIMAFMSFILFLVIKMSTNNNYNHDLVVEDYYKKELLFQKEIDKEANAKALKTPIEFIQTTEGLRFVFPEIFEPSKIKGTMFLYRPSDKSMDISLPLSMNSNVLFLPKKSLSDGRWNIAIDFSYKKKSYLFKAEINL